MNKTNINSFLEKESIVFYGLDGVLYSMPVSDFLSFLISAAAIVYTYRSLLVDRLDSICYSKTDVLKHMF